MRKNATTRCRPSAFARTASACWRIASAWLAISSAVEDSSSADEALRCVIWSTCESARLICATPDDCSEEAAATSWTRSDVFRIEGTSAASSSRERSATLTEVAARPPISRAAAWLRSASLRTSVATTAKPRPCSPARAASIAAFSASRFVWYAISSTIEIFSAIERMASTVSSTERALSSAVAGARAWPSAPSGGCSRRSA